jgi:preprotein translocase subunit Sec63
VFWGIITIGIYLPSFVNENFYRTLLKLKEREDFVILTGFVSLLAGALTLSFVHSLDFSLSGLITLIGVLNVLKSLVRFLFFKRIVNRVNKFNKHMVAGKLFLGVATLLGFYLVYLGVIGLS